MNRQIIHSVLFRDRYRVDAKAIRRLSTALLKQIA